MFTVETDIPPLVEALKETFGTRLVYVGLQGSYFRGEAHEDSDVDIMLVLEDLQPRDLDAYRIIISAMPWAAQACGFVCGRVELSHWNRLELMHLLHATGDLYGALAPLLPEYETEDVRQYIKLSVGNLYHELCHRRLYASREKSECKLAQTAKAAFFVLQDLYWLRTGRFITAKQELCGLLDGDDRAVLMLSMDCGKAESCDFEREFQRILCWCQATIQSL